MNPHSYNLDDIIGLMKNWGEVFLTCCVVELLNCYGILLLLVKRHAPNISKKH